MHKRELQMETVQQKSDESTASLRRKNDAHAARAARFALDWADQKAASCNDYGDAMTFVHKSDKGNSAGMMQE